MDKATRMILTLLDYISGHAEKISSPEMVIAVKQVKKLLETSYRQLLPSLLPTLPFDAHKEIVASIDAVDHFAFMAPPNIDRKAIDRLLDESGFNKDHSHFQSTILSKELGQLVKKAEVSTKVIKAWGESKEHGKIGIELFIPEESANQVKQWINRDQGAHLAFRVKNADSIDLILNILKKHHVQIPPFMNGHAMKNEGEKISVLYCETQLGKHHFRLEFCHQN